MGGDGKALFFDSFFHQLDELFHREDNPENKDSKPDSPDNPGKPIKTHGRS
jgi:hypothetical protein